MSPDGFWIELGRCELNSLLLYFSWANCLDANNKYICVVYNRYAFIVHTKYGNFEYILTDWWWCGIITNSKCAINQANTLARSPFVALIPTHKCTKKRRIYKATNNELVASIYVPENINCISLVSERDSTKIKHNSAINDFRIRVCTLYGPVRKTKQPTESK